VRSFDPIENPSKIRELFSENRVRRHLAHRVDFEPVVALSQAVGCHDLEDSSPFFNRPAEGEHHLDVLEPEVAASPVDKRLARAGKRGLRKVLGRRRGTDGRLRLATQSLAQPIVGGEYRFPHVYG
jgi:hypothetical protein